MRDITLNGYIDEETIFGDEFTPAMVHEALYSGIDEEPDDVNIVLNSYGGSVNAAVRIHDDIAAYPGMVSIVISGTAASAATIVAQAADQLQMTPGSLFMCHDPSMVAMGNERDLKDAIRQLQACKESIINTYAKRCTLSRDQIAALMSKTTWMDANEALKDGFIDGILDQAPVGAEFITDAAISRETNQAEAEAKVRAWQERHKPGHVNVVVNDRPTVTVQMKMPEAKADDEPGTPAEYLNKRLELIKPNDKK